MRTLLLYRHAKSSWEDWSLSDFDRPLNSRGQKAAPLMGAYLKKHNIVPDRILCSPALRTRQTLAHTDIDTIPKQEISFPKSLFHALDMTILQDIRQVDDLFDCTCVIAHNPGLHNLADFLAASSQNDENHQALTKKFPTAALAVFTTTASSWLLLSPENCKLQHFVTPKRLLKQNGAN